MQRVCVYCGSNLGAKSVYSDVARALGAALASQGLELVYGGASRGLMGVLADAVMANGGTVAGVIPQKLVDLEVAHHGLTKLRVVQSMHERKATMIELSDAFIAMPGGFGTIEEFCEVATWAQLGLHEKPHGLLNVAGFFDPLLTFLDRATSERFISAQHRKGIICETDPVRLLDELARFSPSHAEKWGL